ncbi:MAG TPA: CBS domain-containing protein [Thermoanaerobaculaceae bacterium]|nr:CBS domain-containing protein [Thermoanaerobaculaceae bacterium]
MVSDRDLAHVDIGRMLKLEGPTLREELATPIIGLMSSDVICVEPKVEIGDVIALLLEHKIGAAPVVEAETHEVVGIISYVDVLRAVQDVLKKD